MCEHLIHHAIIGTAPASMPHYQLGIEDPRVHRYAQLHTSSHFGGLVTEAGQERRLVTAAEPATASGVAVASALVLVLV